MPPLLIGREHRLAGIGQAEIHHHRGAPGQRRLRSGFEIVRGDGAHERHFEMGVRIDAAGHDVRAAGVHDLGTRRRIDRGADRDDGVALDQHVRAAGVIMVDDGAAANEEGHGNSGGECARTETLRKLSAPAEIRQAKY